MNQLWVRISLTFVAIMIFLIWIPSGVYLAFQADQINSGMMPEEFAETHEGPDFLNNFLDIPSTELVVRLLRMLLSITLVGILVGVVSSRGLAAPLHNLARVAQAVGKQDLSQRIDIKGTSEIREVAVAFNSMAAALEEADGLRNNMLADIAHELRTPLTVIQGNLRAILDDVYELDKIEVARLYDQTRQLSRLVEDLHDLTLLEAKEFSLNLRSQNVIDIIEDVAAIYRPIFDEQGINLVLDLSENIPAVEVDRSRLTQCINNLVNNALTHSLASGKITISAAHENGLVEIKVNDTGVGIDPEHLPYIFDRFYRADPDRNRRSGGSGLGLAITQALVRAHGGEVTASSSGKDQGSEFQIVLPSGS